jgi:hypothetical protein
MGETLHMAEAQAVGRRVYLILMVADPYLVTMVATVGGLHQTSTVNSHQGVVAVAITT